MVRYVVVGEDFGNAPAQYHSDRYALTGASGRRLAALAGYQGPFALARFCVDFERTNVVTTQPDWQDRALVARRVSEILERMRGRRTILLGARVAEAFGASDLETFRWTMATDGRTWVARAPHPSGRSHFWNDPDNVHRARKFWRSTTSQLSVDRLAESLVTTYAPTRSLDNATSDAA